MRIEDDVDLAVSSLRIVGVVGVLDQFRDEAPRVIAGDLVRDPEPPLEVIGEGLRLEHCVGLPAGKREHEFISLSAPRGDEQLGGGRRASRGLRGGHVAEGPRVSTFGLGQVDRLVGRAGAS
jgi:hypothetical protein